MSGPPRAVSSPVSRATSVSEPPCAPSAPRAPVYSAGHDFASIPTRPRTDPSGRAVSSRCPIAPTAVDRQARGMRMAGGSRHEETSPSTGPTGPTGPLDDRTDHAPAPAEGFRHAPVMAHEVVELFAPVPDGVVLDATVGGGGHSGLLLERHPGLRVVGLDQDPDALDAAATRPSGRSRRSGSRSTRSSTSSGRPSTTPSTCWPHAGGSWCSPTTRGKTGS